MDENGTKGIHDTSNFQPIDQTGGFTQTSFSNDEYPISGEDRLGFRHLPKLFQYLEEHFLFSALLLSIIGYVVIAAFGSIKTLGQYLGYIIFLCITMSIYNIDKKNQRLIYFLLISIFILLAIIIMQNWDFITSLYHTYNKPFEVNISDVEKLK